MVRTLGDLSKDDKKDDKATESYAGGERSGLAIQNPSGMDEAIARGREAGSIPEGSATVDLYKNGFILNGGAFRPISDPIHQRFYDDITNGVAPEELAPKGSTNKLHMQVNDRRTEDYKPGPAPASSIGVSYARVETKSGDVSEGATAGPLATGQGSVTLDESKPTTTLQIKFGDGTRKPQTFNQDASVQSVYDYVAQCTGVTTFTLSGGFPPKPLNDRNMTLKDAGLLQAQVMVSN